MSSRIQQDKAIRPQILGKLIFKGLGALCVLFCTVAPAFAQNANVISEIRVIGNRRIPKETILARLYSHVGDNYDPATIERDFNSLWNTGYFEDVRIEKEDTPKGEVLDIFVREKPTIREINYKGLNSVTQSDVLDRFKKRRSVSASRVSMIRRASPKRSPL
jgi:outer membrane protein insertion porin family